MRVEVVSQRVENPQGVVIVERVPRTSGHQADELLHWPRHAPDEHPVNPDSLRVVECGCPLDVLDGDLVLMPANPVLHAMFCGIRIPRNSGRMAGRGTASAPIHLGVVLSSLLDGSMA